MTPFKDITRGMVPTQKKIWNYCTFRLNFPIYVKHGFCFTSG